MITRTSLKETMFEVVKLQNRLHKHKNSVISSVDLFLSDSLVNFPHLVSYVVYSLSGQRLHTLKVIDFTFNDILDENPNFVILVNDSVKINLEIPIAIVDSVSNYNLELFWTTLVETLKLKKRSL